MKSEQNIFSFSIRTKTFPLLMPSALMERLDIRLAFTFDRDFAHMALRCFLHSNGTLPSLGNALEVCYTRRSGSANRKSVKRRGLRNPFLIGNGNCTIALPVCAAIDVYSTSPLSSSPQIAYARQLLEEEGKALYTLCNCEL